MIDKTFLEKRIEEKSNERFEKEYREFVNFILNHPIGRLLTVHIGDENIPISNFGGNYALFNEIQSENKRHIHTNYEEVKKQVVEKYKKEETDNLIEKLSSIHYLLQEGN